MPRQTAPEKRFENEATRSSQVPDPLKNAVKYQRLRSTGWLFLIGAVISVVIALVIFTLRHSGALSGTASAYAGLIFELLAAAFLVTAWIFYFKKMRPLVRKMQREARFQARKEQATVEAASQPVSTATSAPTAIAAAHPEPVLQQTSQEAPASPEPAHFVAPAPQPTPAPAAPVAPQPVMASAAPAVAGEHASVTKSAMTEEPVAAASQPTADLEPVITPQPAVETKPAVKPEFAVEPEVAAQPKPSTTRKKVTMATKTTPKKKATAAKPAAKKPAAAAKKPAAKKAVAAKKPAVKKAAAAKKPVAKKAASKRASR